MSVLTEQQIEARKTFIGGSEIAAVLGVHPYQGPIDVFMRKTGLANEFEGNEATWLGECLEEPVVSRFAAQYGATVTNPGTLVHPEFSFIGATPDRIVAFPEIAHSRPSVLEIKIATFRTEDQWGESWTDQYPQHYCLQCQWEMLVTGLSDAILCVYMLGSQELREYRIVRDDALLAMMIDRARSFWFGHVLKGVPPPPDGSASFTEYLGTKYSASSTDEIVLPPEVETLADEFIAASEAVKEAETKKDLLANRLKSFLGHSAKAVGDRYRVSWKSNKPSRKTDWEQVALAYPAPDWEQVVAAHTRETPGARPFLVKRFGK